MRCPNCQRPVSFWRARCRVCTHKLFSWYIRSILLAAIGLFAAIYLLEHSTR
jgi:predicted amidophosphoribosyltransferase